MNRSTTILFFFSSINAGFAPLQSQEAATDTAFSPYFSYVGETWSIASGGAQTGERSLGLLAVGFDWQPSVIPGTLHFEAQSMHGRNPSDYAGDANALTNVSFDEGTRLFQASYGNDFSRGSWKAGLLALDDDFMGSDYAGLFINAAFGPMPMESFNVSAPIWPIGGLGAHALVELTETSNLQLGLYDGNAGDFATNDDGLNNGLRDKEGAMLLLEYALSTATFGGETTWKLGGFHHTGEQFTNFKTDATESGLSALYLVVDHALSESCGLWVRFGASLDEEVSTVSNHLDLGVVCASPIASRPDDQLGLGYLRTAFGDDYHAKNADKTSTESALELTYLAPLSDNFYLQPDLQWIFDAHESRDDVFVLGLRAGLEF